MVDKVIGAIKSLLTGWWTSRQGKREDRYKRLKDLMKSLGEAAAEYEVYLAEEKLLDHNSALARHAAIIGKAQAACKAAGDTSEKCEECSRFQAPEAEDEAKFRKCAEEHENRLTYIGNRRLTRNFVDQDTEGTQQKIEVTLWGDYRNRNRAALTDAMARLAQLISELE